MSTESEFRNALESLGFKLKSNVSFDWSYTHPRFGIVNYHGGYISINRISTLMRDETRDAISHASTNKEKENVYRKYLAHNIECYEAIASNLKFCFRRSGTNYVEISEIVGIDTLMRLASEIFSDR
ncbi:MAG TPA: hypothetical protein PK263_06970 [bacterium]|nr:hypothetical protein [bacterium]